MNRKPPVAVIRQLRKEVGFGCPVNGCGNPYLRWHHFDPPWREQKHHNPKGMIALCGDHHDRADAGAYQKQQLRQFKREGAARAGEVQGRFEWMRNDLLAVVGGNFYYETPIIFRYREIPRIWLNRDDNGYLLLNIRMLSNAIEPRMQLEDNFWISRGQPEDLESPPSGKRLYVKYPNGDMLRVEFFELNSAEAAQRRYPNGKLEERLKLIKDDPFPITAVEVHHKVGGTNIEFGPRETKIGATLSNNFSAYGEVGLDRI